MIKCLLCQEEQKNFKVLSFHLTKKHNEITKEEYYKNYIQTDENESKCVICGKSTKFKNIVNGYNKTCSNRCTQLQPEVKEKIKQKFIENYGGHPLLNKDIMAKLKNTNLERYGVDNPAKTLESKEKTKKTNLEKHGFESHNSSPIVKEKKIQICLEKYGVENVSQVKEIKEKRHATIFKIYGVNNALENNFLLEKSQKTLMKNYGVKVPLKNKQLLEKMKHTNNEKYGTNFVFENKEIKEKIKNTLIKNYNLDHYSKTEEYKKTQKINYYKRLFETDRLKSKVLPLFSFEEFNNYTDRANFKCLKCNGIFTDHLKNGKIPRCYNCFPPLSGTSKYEIEIIDFIKSKLTNAIIIQSDRTQIHPYELDIYLPEYNLAIEFNGLYWHSESQGKDVSYHINKTILCKEKGIQLIHIFEDEWINKVDIIKSMICNKLKLNDTKIYARKCEIQNVNYDISSQFLENNHIQGAIKSNINLGLYYNQELVSLLTLGHSRFNSNYDYEIHRFCNLKNTNVIGGFSKLIKYFQKLNTGSIITYADLRYGTGDVYLNNGFKFLYRSKPNYFYFKSSECKRYSRHKFQKHKLKNILQEYDSELSEYQNMQLNDYERIWDCGNNVYVII